MSESNGRLDALQARVSEALRDLPAATALYLFGSRRTAPDDQDADLDLQLLTDDLPATRRAWPHALARSTHRAGLADHPGARQHGL